MKDFLGDITYDAHNALGEVLDLLELFRKAGFSLVRVQPHNLSSGFAHYTLINVEMSNRNYKVRWLDPELTFNI